MIGRIFLIALKISVLLILFLVLVSAVVMSLWNWLIPVLFGGPKISLLQAGALLLLSRILFGGFHKGGNFMAHQKKKYWRRKFEEKFEQMSPEERKKMADKFKHWTGGTYWDQDSDC